MTGKYLLIPMNSTVFEINKLKLPKYVSQLDRVSQSELREFSGKSSSANMSINNHVPLPSAMNPHVTLLKSERNKN